MCPDVASVFRIIGPARFRLAKAQSTLGLVGNYRPTFPRVAIVTLDLSPYPKLFEYDSLYLAHYASRQDKPLRVCVELELFSVDSISFLKDN